MAEHPDEGTIHAWLDDALPAAEAARIAAHVSGCAECRAAVAEARGLIAGASRVVRALDPAQAAGGSPAWGATPAASAPAAAPASSLWRMLRVTPARAAIAATLIVAAGITMTRGWVARESDLAYDTGTPRMQPAASAPAATPATAGTGALPHRDSLLDSAIARNIAQSVPPRAIAAAPGPAVVVPAAPQVATGVDMTAAAKVAEGRHELAMAKAAPGVAADNAGVGAPAGALSGNATSGAVAAPSAMSRARRDAPVQQMPTAKDVPVPAASVAAAESSRPASELAGQCLRIESATPGAAWGPVHLPITVALLPGTGDIGEARVTPESGANDSAMFTTWRRQTSDSLLFRLRRLGYTGTMQLAIGGDVQAGLLQSAPSTLRLEEVVTTGVADSRGSASAAPAKKAMAAVAAPKADVAVPVGVSITARRVNCR